MGALLSYLAFLLWKLMTWYKKAADTIIQPYLYIYIYLYIYSWMQFAFAAAMNVKLIN